LGVGSAVGVAVAVGNFVDVGVIVSDKVVCASIEFSFTVQAGKSKRKKRTSVIALAILLTMLSPLY
jgi:hypothetical protein